MANDFEETNDDMDSNLTANQRVEVNFRAIVSESLETHDVETFAKNFDYLFSASGSLAVARARYEIGDGSMTDEGLAGKREDHFILGRVLKENGNIDKLKAKACEVAPSLLPRFQIMESRLYEHYSGTSDSSVGRVVWNALLRLGNRINRGSGGES